MIPSAPSWRLSRQKEKLSLNVNIAFIDQKESTRYTFKNPSLACGIRTFSPSLSRDMRNQFVLSIVNVLSVFESLRNPFKVNSPEILIFDRTKAMMKLSDISQININRQPIQSLCSLRFPCDSTGVEGRALHFWPSTLVFHSELLDFTMQWGSIRPTSEN